MSEVGSERIRSSLTTEKRCREQLRSSFLRCSYLPVHVRIERQLWIRRMHVLMDCSPQCLLRVKCRNLSTSSRSMACAPTPKAWVDKTVRRMANGLRLQHQPPAKDSTVRGIELWTASIRDQSDTTLVRSYSLVWSGLTKQKEALCYDSSEKVGHCQDVSYPWQRAKINGEIKSTLLNDCLADAIVYLGPQGQTIREAFRAALNRVAVIRAQTTERPLFLISESLGSKILTDALVGHQDKPEAVRALRSLAATRQIFMAANQLPLLGLADSASAKARVAAPSPIHQLKDAIERERSKLPSTDAAAQPLSAPIRIVAFTDPNDLLSYTLPEDGDRQTTNVIVSNGDALLGQIENPATAHQGYLDNERVWELIACGVPRMSECGS